MVLLWLMKKLKGKLAKDELLPKSKIKNINTSIEDFKNIQAKRSKIKAKAVSFGAGGGKHTSIGKSPMKFTFIKQSQLHNICNIYF